jgi:trigger factor
VTEANKLEVTLDKAKGLERRMTVRVPAAAIEQQINARLAKVGRTAKLKGFRPGKAPPKVIRQRFGAEVRQEVLSDVIRSSYSQAITEQQLRPAGGPAIEPLPDDGTHFGYRAVFEVYPEVEVAALEKLALERPEVEILDADIDEMIEKLRQQRAEWRTVERKAEAGDRVVIDFLGRIDGEPFAGSEGKEIGIVIGDGQVIPDFEKALQGLGAGDSKVAKVKFPKDYPSPELAGKKAEFEITAHRVEERELPAVDEAFMEAFGVTEGGLEGLRREVRENMQRELNERLRAETKTQTLDALLAANTMDVPRALVRDEIGNLQAAAMQRMGVSDPAAAPAAEQFEDLARRRVALGLIVERLIKVNDMTLDRDRVDERIRELAEPYDKPEEAMYVYRTNRDLMAQVESSVLEDQIVDLVLEKAKIKPKKHSFKEFMNTP